ncbi:GNAT family N-acetyltransferase [Acidisoma cladoniae]|jgi:GNAT superfamily N-acetyltransferase|uniref:GNAT family N-acetyltransferase n=1 Tax=Acidisoma cladoniae TaxID=3040935 RepID=UPI00254C99BD|nr:GNAT family N-acetyltransferase [Acidisoma sp. PAMC 29798]
MDGSDVRIVTIAERPDLARLVAWWQQEAFGSYGQTLDEATVTIESQTAARGPEQAFVLLADEEPAGTASLTHHDLHEEWPLTPWLASVYVQPQYRGRGYASRLVRCVEDEARTAGVGRLWLYTGSSEAFYARLGWVTERLTSDRGRTVCLMRRELF